MSEAQCACNVVVYSPRKHQVKNPLRPNGEDVTAYSDRWMCKSCSAEFVPKRVSDTLAQSLENASEEIESAKENLVILFGLLKTVDDILIENGAPPRNTPSDPQSNIRARFQEALSKKAAQ